MNLPTPAAVLVRKPNNLYFGKLPSRGDFVRSLGNARLIGLVDSWITQGMERLIADPAWRHNYDQTAAIDFAFLGPASRHAVSGALMASRDASGRRFPFLIARSFELEQPEQFLRVAPLLLQPDWARQRELLQDALTESDPNTALSILGTPSGPGSLPPAPPPGTPPPKDGQTYNAGNTALADEGQTALAEYADFLARTTLEALQRSCAVDHPHAVLRETLLALSILLQPLRARASTPPARALALPIPRTSDQATLMRTLWLDLISRFLPRNGIELGLYNCNIDARPYLVVSFSGASARTFCGLFGAPNDDDYFVFISQAPWVEDLLAGPHLQRLANLLDQPGLSLQQLVTAYREVLPS